MKPRLLLLLLLGPLLPDWAQAQFGGLLTPTGPINQVKTLTYRATNSNELDLTLRANGAKITPSSSQTIAGEIRVDGQDQVLYTVYFSLMDTAGAMKTMLPPNLAAGTYTFGLLRQQTGLADFRAGIARLNIVRVGTITSLTEVNSLSVSISSAINRVDVVADNTPANQIGAYYANQAQLAAQQAQANNGVTPLTYPLPNVGPVGYRITHGKKTRYVIPLFLRQDTGTLDRSWGIKIIDLNTVEVVGVQGETFPGQLQLTFLFPTSAN